MSLMRLLVGRRLASDEIQERKIGVFAGLPALGLDGIGSSAYGPEAALTVLIVLGASGPHYIRPVTLAILALLAILYLSYRQTIAAYPSNGGSYTVAKENLGTRAGLVAAAALMLDYLLNVAVGISAGVGALVSAVPSLHPYAVPLCLGFLALVTIVNLRGTLEAGWAFALPTYVFIASFSTVIGLGIVKLIASGGAPAPVEPPPPLPEAAQTASLWLLLRAFASGCTAMTGVEAVSNGVSAFAEPVVQRARHTLTAIVTVLAFLLLGIAELSSAYDIGAMDQTQAGYQSVISQVCAAVVGRSTLYHVTLASLLGVLCLSANTSFVDFPRLCRLVAEDGYLPQSFALVGRRLVFTVGILFLAAASAALLIAFGGITEHLIPLFAVGAFLAFTLSQAGMVAHWLRPGGEASGTLTRTFGLAVNATGTVTTATALAVILAAKFVEGAWITLAAIPAFLLVFKSVHRYYARMSETANPGPLTLEPAEPALVIVPTRSWDRLTRKALRFAMQISPDVVAVHLTSLNAEDPREDERRIRKIWEAHVEGPAAGAGLKAPLLEIVETR